MSRFVLNTKKGRLLANRQDQRIILDLPVIEPIKTKLSEVLLEAFNYKPIDFYQAEKPLLIFENEHQIQTLTFDKKALIKASLPKFIVSAPGDLTDIDFVSRYFTADLPRQEDPVTGSAHCVLTPYWAARLKKTRLRAKQISKRAGYLSCDIKNNRVFITAEAVLYSIGKVDLGMR